MSSDNGHFDIVKRPEHYNSGQIECIDAIKAACAELTGPEAILTGNAIKYLWRWKMKGGKRDLLKAIWYIRELIADIDGIKRDRMADGN